MEIEAKLQELGTAFEQFKKANDAQLLEIKTKGYASADTTEKVEKLNTEIGKLEAKIEALTVAMNRTGNGGVDDKKAQHEAKVGEYKEAFSNYMRKGKEIPAELRDWAAKSMSVDSDQDGGFFVSPEVSSEIVTKVYESSPIRELASQQTISTDRFDILQDLGEAGYEWIGETATRDSNTSTPTLNMVEIPVHELHACPRATQKLLDDAAVNLEAWLSGKVSSAFARGEATAFVSGNGVKKPKGITAYASGTSFGQIQRKETAANSAITSDELIDTQGLLKEAYQNNATWLINRSMITYIRKLVDSVNGQYLWQPGLTVGQPGTLLGRPVRMAADLPSSITASTDTIIYGDIRAGYQIVDRVGIRVIRDIYTVKGFTLFDTTKRVGGGVKDFDAIKILKVKA